MDDRLSALDEVQRQVDRAVATITRLAGVTDPSIKGEIRYALNGLADVAYTMGVRTERNRTE